MADVFTKAERSKVMAAIRSRGNKQTELKLVSIFRAAGIVGWRRHPPLLGCPDFVFQRERVVIFVDGCFWHGCRSHFRIPKSNREYWQNKISRNIARDRSTSRILRAEGWRVVRIWSHALASPKNVTKRVLSVLSLGASGANILSEKNERTKKEGR